MVASGADGEKMPVMSSARTRILAQRIETVMNQINSFAATAMTCRDCHFNSKRQK